MKSVIYSDLNQTNPKEIVILEDVKSVYQELYNFFTTIKGERLFEPNLGLNIDDNLFDVFSDENAFQLLNDLIIEVKIQIPRIQPIFAESGVTLDEENHRYNFLLVFTVLGLEDNKFEFYGALFR